MTSQNDHCRQLLAAIIPDRRDLLDKALRHLGPDHFPDPVLRNMFGFLERYSEVTGAILTRAALSDVLAHGRADAGKVALYEETYDLLYATWADEAAFRWSLEQIRELAAERATGTALTESMQILTQGRDGDEEIRGHFHARTHALQRFAEIDRDLSMQEAPEGDMRTEGNEILEDYVQREQARAAGHSLGVEFGVPALDQRVNGINRGELCLIVGYTSDGKSMDLDAPVLTPTGWRRMGDLQVGDEVVDPEGSPSQVVGIYPQGVLPVYRLTFSDGSTAEASGDHLWDIRYWKPVKTQGKQKQQRVRETWTTDQLRARVASRSRNPALVDAPGLATFDFPETPLPMDPYLLGLLLGDGSLEGTPAFFKPDLEWPEVLAAVVPPGVEVRRRSQQAGKCPGYSLVSIHGPNSVTQALREFGLHGKRSWEKFVPEQYKWASAKTRLAVLQGLMDTDGGHERGRATFSSSSEQLRDDVVWLARSLGLRAAPMRDKVPTFTYQGEQREGRVAYRCSVWERPNLRVFRLTRKHGPIPTRDAGRTIISVDYVRDAECQCIKVSAPSQLYVTHDFIPTHNTSLCVQLAWNAVVAQGLNTVILTTETVRNQVRRRIISRHSCLEHFGIPNGLNSRMIKDGTLPPDLKAKLAEVVADFSHNPGYGKCWIVQVPRGASIGYLESKLVRTQRMFNIDLVIMDSLYLLKPDRRRQSLREELNDIIKESKQLSTSFNDGLGIPFISPWQVSRAARAEAERTSFYSASALAETAEAPNSADLIISLLAPWDNDQRVAPIKMQVMKARDGEKANSIEASVDYATCRFYGRDERQDSVESLWDGDPLGL